MMKKKKNDKETIDSVTTNEEAVQLEKTEIDLEKARLIDENNKLNDKVLRLSAEVQNIIRRNNEERMNLVKYDGEEFITKILDVVDNFERAISLDDTNLEDEISKFLSGFKMIYARFLTALKEQGVQEIECLNKTFDPNTMEAVMTEKVEGVETNTVIDVMQKGYIYKDKVIRHAMVKVAE